LEIRRNRIKELNEREREDEIEIDKLVGIMVRYKGKQK
jgi:hypothetical protein